MDKDNRVEGVLGTFRFPKQVNMLIDERLYKLQQQWLINGNVGEKPTKDELVSRILRVGLENMRDVILPPDWDSTKNRVFVHRKKQPDVQKELQSVSRREEF